jgi:hypothetical protein
MMGFETILVSSQVCSRRDCGSTVALQTVQFAVSFWSSDQYLDCRNCGSRFEERQLLVCDVLGWVRSIRYDARALNRGFRCFVTPIGHFDHHKTTKV